MPTTRPLLEAPASEPQVGQLCQHLAERQGTFCIGSSSPVVALLVGLLAEATLEGEQLPSHGARPQRCRETSGSSCRCHERRRSGGSSRGGVGLAGFW